MSSAPKGSTTTGSICGHHECFARFTANREFDLSELSFAKFAAQVTREHADIIGLPVVCSRLFRFSSFYVNRKSGIKTVEDLKGKKVGSPEWAHSAAVYMRGWMHNDMGVKLTDVHWVPGGRERARPRGEGRARPPEGVKLTRVADKSLSRAARRGRDRLRHHRAPADLFPRGPSRRGTPFPGLPRDGRGVLRSAPRSGRSCTSSR